MTYPNEALGAVCKILIDEYDLTFKQIDAIAKDIVAECHAILEARNENAYERHLASLMESGGPDDSAYRRDIIAAGRGHLLGDKS
jgi:hypothetical protein